MLLNYFNTISDPKCQKWFRIHQGHFSCSFMEVEGAINTPRYPHIVVPRDWEPSRPQEKPNHWEHASWGTGNWGSHPGPKQPGDPDYSPLKKSSHPMVGQPLLGVGNMVEHIYPLKSHRIRSLSCRPLSIMVLHWIHSFRKKNEAMGSWQQVWSFHFFQILVRKLKREDCWKAPENFFK